MSGLLRADDRDVLGSPKQLSEDLQSRPLLSVEHLKHNTQLEARNNSNGDPSEDRPGRVEEGECSIYEVGGVGPKVNSEDDVTVSDASDASDTNAMGRDCSSAGGACQLGSNRSAVAEHSAIEGRHCFGGAHEPTHAPSKERQITASNSATKPTNSCAAVHLDLVGEGVASEEDTAQSRNTFYKQLEQRDRIANFQEVIQEAMQRSDEPAQHIAPPRQPDSPGFAGIQLASSTSSSAKYCQGPERLGGVAVAADIDAISLTPPEGHWTRYASPEGYPYLYNAVTGDSKWILENEEESIEEGGFRVLPGVTIAEDGGTPESSRGASSDRNGGMGVDGGAGGMGDGRDKETTEGGSVGTCEVSHSSQDTTDPDARNVAGETPLHLASTQLSHRGLSLLLAGGANIHAVDDRGRTPLHAACASCLGGSKEGDGDRAQECIQLLLSSGALEDARDGNGQTPLHLAALSGSLIAAQALVNAGATATADAAGNSPLHLAAASGNADIMQLFVLRRQADSVATISSVSQEDGSSEKPGHHDGLLRGCIASEALAGRGHERESIGRAPYLGFDTGSIGETHGTEENGVTDIGSIGDLSRWREQEKAEAAILGAEGEGSEEPTIAALSAALFAAVKASSPDDVTAVLDLMDARGWGGSNVRDKGGRTPLHYACCGDDAHMARVLCRAGADREARDCQGSSPLLVAAETGSTACLRILLQKGADPHGPNETGNTPLHLAVLLGNLSCVKVLASCGARLNERNRLGFTPKEGLLNAGPTLPQGRARKALLATLEYVEHVEALSARPQSPTWTAQDGYESETTVNTAASYHSHEGGHVAASQMGIDHQFHDFEATRGFSRRSRGHGSRMATETLPGHAGEVGAHDGTLTASRRRERERQRWEKDNNGGVDERWRGGQVVSSSSRRGRKMRSDHANERVTRSGSTYSSSSVAPFRSHLDDRPAKSQHPSYPEVRPSHSSRQMAGPDQYGGDEMSPSGLRRGRESRSRKTSRDDTAKTCSSRGENLETEHPVGAPVGPRVGNDIWSTVGRAFGSLLGGGVGLDDRGGGPGHSQDKTRPPAKQCSPDQLNRRPPTDSELRARLPSSSSPARLPSNGTDDTRHLSAPASTKTVTTKMPLSLTLMQPPPDVLAAMKERTVMGQRRQRSSDLPADLAADLEKARGGETYAGSLGHAGLGGVRDGAGDGPGGVLPTAMGDTVRETFGRQRLSHEGLGPFSLNEAGGLGGSGTRTGRSMYVDYFEERQRVQQAAGKDVGMGATKTA